MPPFPFADVVLPMVYAMTMKQLPAELDGATTAEKLAYLWVYLHPGEHSARSLEVALGVGVRTALSELTRRGLLIEEIPPAGRRPGHYRVTPQRPGPRPRLTEERAPD